MSYSKCKSYSLQSSFHLEVLFGGVALPHKLAFFVQFLQCKLLTSFALQRNKKVKLYYDLPFHFYGWQRTPSSTYSQDNLLKTAPQFCAAVSEDQIPLTLKLPKSLGDIVLKGKRTHDGRCLEFRLPSELPVQAMQGGLFVCFSHINLTGGWLSCSAASRRSICCRDTESSRVHCSSR